MTSPSVLELLGIERWAFWAEKLILEPTYDDIKEPGQFWIALADLFLLIPSSM